MRQDSMVEGTLVANHKTQRRDKNFKNYPPCKNYGKWVIHLGKGHRRSASSAINLAIKQWFAKTNLRTMNQMHMWLMKKKTILLLQHVSQVRFQ